MFIVRGRFSVDVNAHKMPSVAGKIKEVDRNHCRKEPGLIFSLDSGEESIPLFKAWEAKWLVEEERAVRCMRKDLVSCLQEYDFGRELWKSIRTTNFLGWTFREMRRRTRPMNNFFYNEASVNRIIPWHDRDAQ